MAEFTFWFIVALTISSALMVVSSKSLVYSAYSLLFTFIGVTALYVFLWADFLAVVQVVVYVGGILVLIIFGIMLTNKISSANISHTSVQKRAGVFVVIGFIGVLGYVIF
ncbi:MAG: NADH-quinone oxidoreductase subunit J, partial [Candidatus Neomarinimicrobiota bacterium]|nr:NADH-quinone oxidoreductase subunit J [Candidatus Neomarinimicrobiota bacterium]